MSAAFRSLNLLSKVNTRVEFSIHTKDIKVKQVERKTRWIGGEKKNKTACSTETKTGNTPVKLQSVTKSPGTCFTCTTKCCLFVTQLVVKKTTKQKRSPWSHVHKYVHPKSKSRDTNKPTPLVLN